MESYIDKIAAMGACQPALDWLRKQNYATLQEAWDNCERGDWMLWLYGRTAPSAPWSEERKPLVLAACACARLSLPKFEARYPNDSRPRRCIEATEAWCRGEATQEEVLVARRNAAAAAAYAAAYTAAAAAADEDAAADDAAAAAYAAATYAATDDATYTAAATYAATAKLVHSVLPCPVLA